MLNTLTFSEVCDTFAKTPARGRTETHFCGVSLHIAQRHLVPVTAHSLVLSAADVEPRHRSVYIQHNNS